jgi:hypothetical protein
MFLKDLLMKFARAVLNGIMNEINKAINKVQNEVVGEASKILGSVTDQVWKGEDANAFKQELGKVLIPELNDFIGMTNKLVSGFENAAQVIERADQKVSQVVGDLNNIFAKIY